VQALAATSRHGLLPDPRLFALPLFAVGSATAERARTLGYREVLDADGDAAALQALIRRRLDPASGAVLHLAGEEPSSLAPLTASGFALRVARCYRTRASTALSSDCREALAGNRLDAATFLSPKTAQTFVRLARESRVAEACRCLAAFCLSAAVAEVLDSRSWRRVVVAARPRLDDLIAAIAGTEQEEQPRR
jgi:uroporphyrinogen-III synthase